MYNFILHKSLHLVLEAYPICHGGNTWSVYVLVCSKVMFMRNLNIKYFRLITLTQVHAILSFLVSFSKCQTF